ncbi:MAG: hypothetical protein AAF670_16140 [Planctomycetota bacterium]
MSEIRSSVTWIMVGASAMAIGLVTAVADAQELELPSDTEIPLPEQILAPADAELVRKRQLQIQNALDGQAIETGDPMLNDVLSFMRRRGSILKGSSLDPVEAAAAPAITHGEPLDVPSARELDSGAASAMFDRGAEHDSFAPGKFGLGVPIQDVRQPRPNVPSTGVARLAESLLRSARLLEKISGDDPMVNQLRQRAVKLLTGGMAAHPRPGSVLTSPSGMDPGMTSSIGRTIRP